MINAKDILMKEAHTVYREACDKPLSMCQFTNNEEVDVELRDITHRPYLFVLACVMDRQISAERAWTIPHKVCKYFAVDDFAGLSIITENRYIECFQKENLHRYNEKMAKNFYVAVQRIQNTYNGDASQIWKGNPTSAEVVYRFLCFQGVGIKIATMAANLLVRDYKIPLCDLSAIDVSPDVQVCRILYRLGLTESESREAAIYKAKELNPSYPGIIDLVCWQYGREYCHPLNPECDKCPFNKVCTFNNIINKI